MTYENLAIQNNMPSRMAKRYVIYMIRRWSTTEEQKCTDGYAQEWADRFKSGMEYEYSDGEGQRLLKTIDANLNNDIK